MYIYLYAWTGSLFQFPDRWSVGVDLPQTVCKAQTILGFALQIILNMSSPPFLLAAAVLKAADQPNYQTYTRQRFPQESRHSFLTGQVLHKALIYTVLPCCFASMALTKLCVGCHRIKRVVGRKVDRQSDWNDDELQAGGTSRIYLVTTSTAMADERTWEREYCIDDHYKAPTEEDRAKIQV